MNWRAIMAVARKDIRVVLRSKMLMMVMILVPLIMMVLIPGILGGVVVFGEFDPAELDDMTLMMEAMPPTLLAQFEGYSPQQTFLVLSLLYMFAPMYLIVPMMVASVIAADSFAGEKERKTIEAVLHSPLTNREFMIGKFLAAWIPAIVVSVVAFLLYGIVANGIGWPVMGRLFFPNVTWLVLAFWVAPAASGLGLGVTVLVSARVKTFQEAYQFGGIVVLPVVGLVFAQISGVLYLSAGVTAILGLVLFVIDGVVLWFGIQSFSRDKMLSQI